MDELGSTATLEPLSAGEELEEIISSARLPSEDMETPDSELDSASDLPSSVAADRSIAGAHTCGFCGDAFPSYATLLEHRSKHGGDRPYACHVCDKRFTQKAHLIIHRRTHTGEKPYACHICHKRFAQSSHLNSHKRVHTGEKPFFCSICNMGFCRRQRLEAHLQQHARDVEGLMMASKSSDFVACPSASSPSARLSALADDVQKGRGENSSTARQAVFPEFSSGVGGEEGSLDASGVNIKQEQVSDGEENGYGAAYSPTHPLPVSSCSTPKNRRKPTFVRRFGADRSDSAGGKNGGGDPKYIGDADDSSAVGRGGARTCEDKSVDLSAHEAAVDALIKMATGADLDEADSVEAGETAMSDDGGLQGLLLKHSFLSVAGGPAASHQRLSAKLPAPGLVRQCPPSAASGAQPHLSSLIRTNNRVTLVDFTADDLLRHLMSRDDVYRCDFCRVIFHDAAMYHLHRSMHDKMDIRCCNLCGKLLVDKYDFTAHFLSQHK